MSWSWVGGCIIDLHYRRTRSKGEYWQSADEEKTETGIGKGKKKKGKIRVLVLPTRLGVSFRVFANLQINQPNHPPFPLIFRILRSVPRPLPNQCSFLFFPPSSASDLGAEPPAAARRSTLVTSAARQEHEHHADEGGEEGDHAQPYARGPVGGGWVGGVVVDARLDSAEQPEVDGHGDKGHSAGQRRRQRGAKAADKVRANAHHEGEHAQAACDRVQHERLGQPTDRPLRGARVVGARRGVERDDLGDGVIAEVRLGALVICMRDGNAKSPVSKHELVV